MYSFELTRPGTVQEAVATLAGGEAQALAGGQTLIPTLKQRLADPGTLVSLSGIAEMRYVRAQRS
jgi:carbon-monoxide dehydrogenase medium subunit